MPWIDASDLASGPRRPLLAIRVGIQQLPPLGKAVQVDPINPKLKPPGTKRLKLYCDIQFSSCAFTFNLSRYNLAIWQETAYTPLYAIMKCVALGRDFHSSTSQLNLSRFLHENIPSTPISTPYCPLKPPPQFIRALPIP